MNIIMLDQDEISIVSGGIYVDASLFLGHIGIYCGIYGGLILGLMDKGIALSKVLGNPRLPMASFKIYLATVFGNLLGTSVGYLIEQTLSALNLIKSE